MTTFDEIIDRALIVVNDYRLDKLFNYNSDDFKMYCDGFLISAIPHFPQCRQALEYDADNRNFYVDLTLSEQSILAGLWVIEWYSRDNQTYALYRQHLQNAGSFKNHSESQNLKENSVYADKLREEINRQIVAYQLEDLSTYLG